MEAGGTVCGQPGCWTTDHRFTGWFTAPALPVWRTRPRHGIPAKASQPEPRHHEHIPTAFDDAVGPEADGDCIGWIAARSSLVASPRVRQPVESVPQGRLRDRFLFDRIAADQAASGERADRIGPDGELPQMASAVGGEGATRVVVGFADVDDMRDRAGWQVLVDAGGDPDATEVRIGADHCRAGLLGRLDDEGENGLGWLAMAPDDR